MRVHNRNATTRRSRALASIHRWTAIPAWRAGGLLPLILLLVACAASRIPATSFAEPSAVERTVKRYYERHASEENRTCLSPYIEGLTRVSVAEDTPERLVLDVRYLYRDRFKDDRDNGMGRECSGYAERRFTLAKNDAGIEVVEMTGP